jgi:hypothetical protein
MNRCRDVRINGEMTVDIKGKLVKQIGRQNLTLIFRYMKEMPNLYLDGWILSWEIFSNKAIPLYLGHTSICTSLFQYREWEKK